MSNSVPSGKGDASLSSHMEQVFSRDMGEARENFEHWLISRMADKANVALLNFDRPLVSGLSHELISADVTWREKGVGHSLPLMIRLDPVRYRKRRTSNLHREFEILSILSDGGDVPVPDVFWYEKDTSVFGAEFYVMRRLEGRVLGDPPFRRQGWFFELQPEGRSILWNNAIQMLAKIHLVPIEKLTLLRRENNAETDVEQHFNYWRSSYEWATASQPNPIADKGWDWLIRNRPASYPQGLSWGDAHPRNMIFQGFECSAVLDWEDVSLSSPLFDLARWFLTDRLMGMAGFPELEGVPSRAEIIESWERLTGYSADALHWFELLACCGGTGNLARTAQIQMELFGKAESAESKWLPALNSVIEELLAEAGCS